MGKILRIPLTAAAFLALAGCDFEEIANGHGARFTEDFREEHAMPPGGRLSVENVNGSVEITGWDRDRIEIDGTKYANSKELLPKLKMELHKAAGVFEIRTVRPESWSGNGGIRYRIHVPRKTRLERIHSTNGSLTATAIDNPVKLRTTNGSIKLVDVTGEAEASSTNGSIHATGIRGRFIASTTNGGVNITAEELVQGASSRIRTTNGGVTLAIRSGKLNDIEASTTNGGISVRIPAGTDTRIRASTTAGRISTDLPIADKITDRGRRLDAALGAGGPLLDLRTTNGGVRIERY